MKLCQCVLVFELFFLLVNLYFRSILDIQFSFYHFLSGIRRLDSIAKFVCILYFSKSRWALQLLHRLTLNFLCVIVCHCQVIVCRETLYELSISVWSPIY